MEHSTALEWDVQHFWPGRELNEIFTGEMTWRELKVFIRHLPRESATSREMFGEAASWGPEAYVLADVVDVLIAANSEKGKKPKPYPRPVIPTSE